VFSIHFGFPNGLVVEGTVGSSELNLVGRLGSIASMGSPAPNQFILLLTVKFRQPSHEFTFGVGMTFVSYPLVPTPVV
jgi:hypothetical protein